MALVAAGHGRTEVKNLTCTSVSTFACGAIGKSSETGVAAAFGGGLDVRLNDRLDFRAFQVDYNPIKFDGRADHNVLWNRYCDQVIDRKRKGKGAACWTLPFL